MTTNDTYRGIRVTLQGTLTVLPVGLKSRICILHASDGRGLRVYPAKDTQLHAGTVRITGTLQFNDQDVPSLHMKKGDKMEVLPDSPKPTPRDVDMENVEMEDYWSLTPKGIVDGRRLGRLLPV